MAAPDGRRWFQIPLSSARVPRSGLFSYSFQAGLQRYQQLRAHRHLRVGPLVAPPPPGLLEPWPPGPPPTHSPARASPHSRRARVRARRRPKDSRSARKRVSRGQQPPGLTQPRDSQQDEASRGSPPCQVAPDGSGHVPVLPEAPVGSAEGEASGGQHTAAQPAPQQTGGSFGRHSPSMAREQLSPPDSEDDNPIPLQDVLLARDEPSSPADDQQVACPRPDPVGNSLDLLLQEEREQNQETALPTSLAWVHIDDASPCTSLEEDSQLPEEDRAFLDYFSMELLRIPTVHPGEAVFRARLAPPPTLDTRGLEPRNMLERFFLHGSPTRQAAFVHCGGLSLLYRCVLSCPLPVLRWLFQLMTQCPDSTNASQALWEIWLSTRGEPWCPSVQEICRAFIRLGADLSLLHLLPLKLHTMGRSSLDLSCSPRAASPGATSTLALATQLSDICKFLTLCVVTRPCRYGDNARLTLITLLTFLGLDRTLRCQPLPELQHLLHCLLGGIRAWQEQLPTLCQILCQLSQHHHNLVALVQLLPHLTSRDRELCRHLSLHAMARLLRQPPGALPPPGAHAELQVLSRFMALAQPDALQRFVLAGGLEDTEQQACYLSHSLLLLASDVVGIERPPAEKQGDLEQLCTQLEQHWGLREDPRRLFCSQLKGLATLLCVKWREMLV